VADIVKKAGDIDLYRRICSLEGEVIDLTRANRHLERENEALKAKLAQRENLTFREPFFYAANDPVPFCPRCWESDQKAVHLQGPTEVAAGKRFNCAACKQYFITDRPEKSPMSPSRGGPRGSDTDWMR